VVTTRRGLLLAGAGLAVAGCGATDDEPPPDAELLAPSLAAALALAGAYERAGGRIGRALASREREHAERLRAAGARAGARRPAPAGGAPLEGAVTLERAALRAHVHAVGLVRALPSRSLLAELMADDARHLLVLRGEVGGTPIPSAFPDGRDG
jgi:hypothetical protein